MFNHSLSEIFHLQYNPKVTLDQEDSSPFLQGSRTSVTLSFSEGFSTWVCYKTMCDWGIALILDIYAFSEVITERVHSQSNREGRQKLINTKESNIGCFSFPALNISFIEAENRPVISKDWKAWERKRVGRDRLASTKSQLGKRNT